MQSVPEARIIADSISHEGVRLTTMEVKMHRFVLAEFNTHRAFSRNSASSRAIPAKRIREMVTNDPAMPLFWGKNQAGMQAAEELGESEMNCAIAEWLEARNDAIMHHLHLEEIGVHKQLANRILEPWLWHRVIVSSTEWDNFFNQRVHKDAQPEMGLGHPIKEKLRGLAKVMFDVYSTSEPRTIGYDSKAPDGWHLPYINDQEADKRPVGDLVQISSARCARVSYLTHDGVRDMCEDIKLFNKLANQRPGHWSPLEHVAKPQKASYEKTGNFTGWVQLRSLYETKPVKEEDPKRTGVFSQIEGLTPVDPAAVEDFKQAMTKKVIPEIVKAVERRRVLAAESRRRHLKY